MSKYTVPVSLFENIKKRVQKLNKRGNKIGGSIELSNVEETTIEQKQGEKLFLIPAISFSVIGEIPVVSGYALLARIEHTEVGNLISSFDENFDYKSWVDAKNNCDHCSMNRKRRDTFVLRNVETGEIRQIGRSCMADYLRTSDVDHLMKMFIFWADIERECRDSESWGSYVVSYVSVEDYVSCSCASVRRHGYVPKSFGAGATYNDVMYLIHRPGKYENESYIKEWEAAQPIDADIEMSKQVIAWVKEKDASSGYLHNLKVAIELGYVTERTAGLVVSSVAAYKKEVGESLRKYEEEQKPSEYVGNIGDRIDVVAKLQFSKDIESVWGVSWLVVFVDDNGNTYSGFVPYKNFRDGFAFNTYKIRGTVKEHKEYNDVKQTVLSRMKLEGVE